jgi:pyrroloquinoline quinone biosynthesis protein B
MGGMRIKVLGSAAGGGFPQWNCACPNCRRLRNGTLAGTPRAQTQLAWSSTPGQWALVNASPDLRAQIETTPELWPQSANRHSPIRNVVLTGGEVDEILGLLVLREFHSFRIHATRSIRKILTEDNSLFGVLARYAGQVSWSDIPLDKPFFAGEARLEALRLPGSFPRFVSPSRIADFARDEAVIGLSISSEPGGSRLAFLPAVCCISDGLLEQLKECDVLLFDGTFWSGDEPAQMTGVGRSARDMGHLPIGGTDGSLARLAGLRRSRKIFIHINNTNPILDAESAEYRTVCEAGWEVAWDGMEITL